MQADLWQFAVELYQRPGVEQACLSAQNKGYNACLLLCAAWLDQRSVIWQPSHLQQLSALAEAFELHYIKPLRQLRNAWKLGSPNDAELEQLRQQVKALELEAERLLLKRLQTLSQNWPRSETVKQHWLTTCSSDPELHAALNPSR